MQFPRLRRLLQAYRPPPEARYAVPERFPAYWPIPRPMHTSELRQIHGESVAKSKPEFVKGQAAFERQNGK